MEIRYLGRAVERLLCRLRGHRFVTFSEGFKRECACCKREEWVMSREYPIIGQAKYFWQHMDWR